MRKYFLALTFLIDSSFAICQIDFDNYEAAIYLNNSALIDIENNDYYTAIPKILKALLLDSTNRNAYINLSYAYNQINQHILLVPHLEKAKQIFIEDDEILYYTGNVYQKIEDLEKAINNYDSAIIYSKVNGEDFELVYAYYLNRGICFLKQQKFEQALEDFNYALKLDGNKSSIYANRASTYFQLKMIHEACFDWVKANELGEKSVYNYILIFCNN